MLDPNARPFIPATRLIHAADYSKENEEAGGVGLLDLPLEVQYQLPRVLMQQTCLYLMQATTVCIGTYSVPINYHVTSPPATPIGSQSSGGYCVHHSIKRMSSQLFFRGLAM